MLEIRSYTRHTVLMDDAQDLIGAEVTDVLGDEHGGVQWVEVTLPNGAVLTLESLNGADLRVSEAGYPVAALREVV